MRLIHATKIGLQLRNLATKFLRCPQGRRHGFESGGGQFCERSEPKKIFDPPLFGQWGGTKYCLDS